MAHLHVMLNEKEQSHLMEHFRNSGLTKSKYLRALILGQEIHPRPPEEIDELLRQMSAIGNNINQIAKVANSAHFVRKEDMEAIQKMQDELWQAIKEL